MKPTYINENRYSYLVGSKRKDANMASSINKDGNIKLATSEYKVKNPASDFEQLVQELFLEGQEFMQREQYQLALDTFRELMALILRTCEPQMPVDPNLIPRFDFPYILALIDTLTQKSADILKQTPIPAYTFPSSVISPKSILPESVKDLLKPVINHGLTITSFHSIVIEQLEKAFSAIAKGNFTLALQSYSDAMKNTPVTEEILQASLLHDMAILVEKADDKTKAQEFAQRSAQMFEAAGLTEAFGEALDTLTGILKRADKQDLAAEQAKKSLKIHQRLNFNTLFSDLSTNITSKNLLDPTVSATRGTSRSFPFEATLPEINFRLPLTANLLPIKTSTAEEPKLMAMKYVQQNSINKTLTIQGENTTATLKLEPNSSTCVKEFLNMIRDTKDLPLLTDFWRTPVQMIAYLPHMYFFVIPMSIGDCFAEMGNLQEAEEQYRSVLPYPFINKQYEIVKLWTRLAQVYLDIGDKAYRIAKDNTNAFTPARAAYENIVLGNKTLNANSPLYHDAAFASIKTRVTNFLTAADPVAHNDNPAIMSIVLGAFNKLQQIQAGFNFFGLPPDSPPPFSFEYMQNTARYFAQQASNIEQRYIQYMDQAENEEFRREQLDQQAEVAYQSVILEERGVAEAEAGINTAQASLDYAVNQQTNSVAEFNEYWNKSRELEIIAATEAYANALTAGEITGSCNITISHSYLGYQDMPRSRALEDLAHRRASISAEMEINRLQHAYVSAGYYQILTEKQLDQAKARKAIAEQRYEIAKLQQHQAEENRDFLDMREFSAHLWRELALQAKRLKQRYLDMATEMALLMERAYNAETERKLQVIRSDYSVTAANNLMGADQLLADIDYFTYDYITTVRTKKIPVKQVISLADSYVMAFQQLKTTGHCFLQTELADFDRQHPGMYLCKLRNVELIFVGLANVSSLAGSLRNVGVSRFRQENGSVLTRLYPSEVIALSQYDIRQDALAFRFNPNELRLFENSGIDTLWQIDLPLYANDFDCRDLLDIHLIIYYDGFFSPSLEQTILASLPKNGSASRAFSLRMSFFDELYYLKNKGEGEFSFDANFFPRNQKDFKRTLVTLKALGKPSTVENLTLRLTSANHGSDLLLTTDAQGEVSQATPGQPLEALKNEPMLDTWTLHITANDNPTLVNNSVLDLTGLEDILIFFEYSFDYR